MNLLLITPEDRRDGDRVIIDDGRAEHMRTVLNVKPQDRLRAGVLDGPRGTAVVESVHDAQVVVRLELEDEVPPREDITLLLALPRPRVLKRLLPEITALGVGRIVLTETERVEKAFFGATFLRPEVHRPLLYEGLMQAKLTRLPEVVVERRLWRFLKTLPEAYAEHTKLVAHPDAATHLARVPVPADRPVLLAVGPEGGFIDPEVERLAEAGFQPVTMGSRILRVETACVGLLAQVDLQRARG